MRYILLAFALVAALVPAAAAAQTSPGLGPPPPGGGPPPDRARFEQFRADAKANALKALSADHQTNIQAIVNSLTAGSLTPRDAIAQIDALLSPDESKAILDQEQKVRGAMVAARDGSSTNPNPPAAAPGPSHGQGAKPDAGRFLLRLLLSPVQMRALRNGQAKPQ
jgi:hypothetical protein